MRSSACLCLPPTLAPTDTSEGHTTHNTEPTQRGFEKKDNAKAKEGYRINVQFLKFDLPRILTCYTSTRIQITTSLVHRLQYVCVQFTSILADDL